VKIEGDPLNTQHAHVEEELEEDEDGEEEVFTRENRRGSAQQATRATPTPTRSSQATDP
jgi:hypothetical protein